MDNPNLKKLVFPETAIKNMLVEFTGNKFNPDSGDITIQMIIETLAEEFPELILAIAEENFFRGYEQAMVDADSVKSCEE